VRQLTAWAPRDQADIRQVKEITLMRGTAATSTTALMLLAAAIMAPTPASAHVSVSSGPGFANTTQEISFSVGHGCTDASGAASDTSSVTIDIPAGVSSVRAVPNAFGKVTVTRTLINNVSTVTAVTWTKAAGDVLAGDDDFYKLTIRAKIPNAPFTTVYFPAHQTCTTGTGTVLPVVDWVATAPNPTEDAGAAAEPAPALVVLPARVPGWNKITVPVAVAGDKLAALFADAQIVWKGTAAFSANPATTDQIKTTSGVTVLAALAAGDEIWVKY
jgi:uncharacterized protein YcnI